MTAEPRERQDADVRRSAFESWCERTGYTDDDPDAPHTEAFYGGYDAGSWAVTALVEEVERLQALVVEHHAIGYMDGLTAGDPCPVCERNGFAVAQHAETLADECQCGPGEFCDRCPPNYTTLAANLDPIHRPPEYREGMVTVRGHDQAHLGCMGTETWKWLLGHPEMDAPALDRLVAQHRDTQEALAEQRTRSTLTRLEDAKAIGLIFDHSREALEAAYAELERAEQHHRWHHDEEGREVEEDDERLRVLMVIAEAIEELPEPITEDAEQQVEALRAAALASVRARTPI